MRQADESTVLDDAGILDDAGTGNDPEPSQSDGDSGIRCPICAWKPEKDSRWMCNCRHVWNTFDTGGVCPGCLVRWAYTACPSCGSWSPHSDWYRKL